MEDREAHRICGRGIRAAEANYLRRTVAAMKPEAQPRHRQDSQQAKDAPDRTSPGKRRTDSASPHDGFTDLHPDAGKTITPTMDENALISD
ncbi:hypothetical protein D9M69_602420 [compost metagenome]